MNPTIYINASTLCTAIGNGWQANSQSLQKATCGLKPCDFGDVDFPCYAGLVTGIDEVELAEQWRDRQNRATQLCELTLQQDGFLQAVEELKQDFAPERIGLVLGTSNAGIITSEDAYRRRDDKGALPEDFKFLYANDFYSLTDYLQQRLDLKGPAYTISTACSSSAKVFVDAQQLIEAGLCDAVIVAGIDSLCLTTLYGFTSLELVSPEASQPFDVDRQGLSIGEAAGFCIISKNPKNAIATLAGYGESSDAHHMSTPHPEGRGAQQAMEAALTQAKLTTADIGYINLHGTGTPANDTMEALAVKNLFGTQTACSSTKCATGHTLGAAGLIEALFSIMALNAQLAPSNIGLESPESDIALVKTPTETELNYVMTNSFGFGGNNASLIFSPPPSNP